MPSAGGLACHSGQRWLKLNDSSATHDTLRTSRIAQTVFLDGFVLVVSDADACNERSMQNFVTSPV